MEKAEIEKLYNSVKSLSGVHKNNAEVEAYLKHQTSNSHVVNEVLSLLKKDQHAVRNKNGLLKLIFGSLFLASSFVITCVNFHSNQPFAVVMYGFTTFGLVFVVWGLYELMH
jgi:hypothetical protein